MVRRGSMRHTLQRTTERKPTPPMLPIVPFLFRQWSQPCAKTVTKASVTSAYTRTNMENTKGTRANGRCATTVVAVGNVSCNHMYACAISETSVPGSSEGVSRFSSSNRPPGIRPDHACGWALDSEASSGSK